MPSYYLSAACEQARPYARRIMCDVPLPHAACGLPLHYNASTATNLSGNSVRRRTVPSRLPNVQCCLALQAQGNGSHAARAALDASDFQKIGEQMAAYDERRETVIKRCRGESLLGRGALSENVKGSCKAVSAGVELLGDGCSTSAATDMQKNAKQAIFSLHRGNEAEGETRLRAAMEVAKDVSGIVGSEPDLRHGSYAAAMEEVCHATGLGLYAPQDTFQSWMWVPLLQANFLRHRDTYCIRSVHRSLRYAVCRGGAVPGLSSRGQVKQLHALWPAM